MALNTNPIYSGVGDIQFTTVLTAVNASYDATAANAGGPRAQNGRNEC